MAWLFGEEKFGQYTYEHWFDEKQQIDLEENAKDAKNDTTDDPCNTTPDTPSQRQEPSCRNPCSQDL